VSSEGLLSVADVAYAFGGVRAVDGCSLEVKAGSIAALVGPNGAGKSTLVSLIAGERECERGAITFAGTDITHRPAHEMASLGLIRTFQLSRQFGSLTVLENLIVAAGRGRGESLWEAVAGRRSWRGEQRDRVSRALQTLEEFGLYPLRNSYANDLSGGQKRLLELARAVMAEPKLLLLDEPLAGVNPTLVDDLCARIGALRDRGVTFLLVEHNLEAVERLCDHVIVMALGRAIATGTMASLRDNEAVVTAYLGEGAFA